MRTYKLDTTHLPKVWVTWTSTKNGQFNQRFWLNCQTGKKKNTPESWMYYEGESSVGRCYLRDINRIGCGCNYYTVQKPKIWVNSGTNLRYAYIKYHKDIDRLEIAAVGIDTCRAETPREWKFLGDRFFIGRDKSIVDQNGKYIQIFYLDKYHYAYSRKELISMFTRLNTPSNFIEEFKKFIGKNYYTRGNGQTIFIKQPYHLQNWYTTVQRTRTTGKQQAITDKLTEITLSDTTGFEEKYPIKVIDKYSGWPTTISNLVYYERVDDKMSVLRGFIRKNEDDKLCESWRMYIGDDGFNRIVSKTPDGWIPSKQVRDHWCAYSYVVNLDEAVEKCNRIKYIVGSNNEVSEIKMVDYLITALRFPEIEQLAKLGYTQHCLRIVGNYTPKAYIKEMFGGYYDEKEKNLLRKVGMTKEQLDYHLSSESYRASAALKTMREMFGDNLSSMDKNSFVKYYEGCLAIHTYMWRGLNRYTDVLNLDKLKFFKNICRLNEKRDNVWTIVSDTLSAYIALNYSTRPEIDWYFDNVSDVVRVHDAVTELKRIQDTEIRARWDRQAAERLKKEEEKRIKLDEKRKELEYEDEEYIIRLPKDCAEIIREGSTQHICIGGYASRHATGGTNLFFLRRKDTESFPFYAIEMNNQKEIIQIHGFGNKWLGNNPEAIPTVIRWLRKNNISCKQTILTCKAQGYGSVNEYVPMPIVD